MKKLYSLLGCLLCFVSARSQKIDYPYPVSFVQMPVGKQTARMAYMDVLPSKVRRGTVLLLHGKNFNGFYWREVIPAFSDAGYRVIVPDQVGWGRSDKPDMPYSFHQLAYDTHNLLDSLGVKSVHVIGHSMGGMVATRFALMYPAMVKSLVLENPIGLEDYRTFVPYRPTDSVLRTELQASLGSLRKYQQSYYPVWEPSYEPYVTAQYEALQYPGFEQASRVSALTYQMIYEQPVLYEFRALDVPTLLVIGQEDRTVVGKNLLSKQVALAHGNYPALGRWLQQQVRGSKLVPLPGVGHIPHIQVPDSFLRAVIPFLAANE